MRSRGNRSPLLPDQCNWLMICTRDVDAAEPLLQNFITTLVQLMWSCPWRSGRNCGLDRVVLGGGTFQNGFFTKK